MEALDIKSYLSYQGQEVHPYGEHLPGHYASLFEEHTKDYSKQLLDDLWEVLDDLTLRNALDFSNVRKKADSHCDGNDSAMQEGKVADMDDDDDASTTDENDLGNDVPPYRRLIMTLNALRSEEANYVLTPMQRCRVIHRILHLLSACEKERNVLRVCEIQVRLPGRQFQSIPMFDDDDLLADSEYTNGFEPPLSVPFALPINIREILLSAVLNLFQKKDTLRHFSRTAILIDEMQISYRLLINWKSLFYILMRTAPYLDENTGSVPNVCTNGRSSQVLRRTVQLIKASRRYFAEGAEEEVWSMVESDLLFKTHTNACFRAQVILYNFLPSQCSPEFYSRTLPKWLKSWSCVDRCIDFDMTWLILFGRARKYLLQSSFDWSLVQNRILTYSGYWFAIPVGASDDGSKFPTRAPSARSFPSRLKSFLGLNGSGHDGVKFVAKLAKLLIFCVGYDVKNSSDSVADEDQVSSGTKNLLRFLSFVSPYFNSSNTGSWSASLSELLRNMCFCLSYRLGVTWAHMNVLCKSHSSLAKKISKIEPIVTCTIPSHELILILDSLLPLCQEALYSKNSLMSTSGQSALVDLAHIAPHIVVPFFLQFACNTLHVSSINQSHQAPVSLAVLSSLVYPSLKFHPKILLNQLPELLNLSLDGISCNDEAKTFRTLVFYRNVCEWIPIGKSKVDLCRKKLLATKFGNIQNKHFAFIGSNHLSDQELSIEKSIKNLSETSIIYQCQTLSYEAINESDNESVLSEISVVMSDWSLAFLHRIYDLFRAAGEKEKTGKGFGYTSRVHSYSDAHRSRIYSLLIKESLIQVFCAMDKETLDQALRSLMQFLTETLPFAVKNVSYLCGAISYADSSCLNKLIPYFSSNLSNESKATVMYKLRCFAASVRHGGEVILSHRRAIMSSIEFALSSSDKHVFKCGCKLLRHVLFSQSEAYPIASGFYPSNNVGCTAILGELPTKWHYPTGGQIDFCAELVEGFVIQRIKRVTEESLKCTNFDVTKERLMIQSWRRLLKIIRYTLRGIVGILLDGKCKKVSLNEKAIESVLSLGKESSTSLLRNLRPFISYFLTDVSKLSCTQSDGAVCDKDISKNVAIYADVKIVKETLLCFDLLLTQRGAVRHLSDNLSKIQKQTDYYMTDYSCIGQIDHVSWSLQRSGLLEGRLLRGDQFSGFIVTPRILTLYIWNYLNRLQQYSSHRIQRKLKDECNKMSLDELSRSSYSRKREELVSYFDFVALTDSKINDGSDIYRSIFDGICGLSCHSHPQIRSRALNVLQIVSNGFGWLLRKRIARLLHAIDLSDTNEDNFGIPSCERLRDILDSNGKRKALSETMKGVCSIITLKSCTKAISLKKSLRLKTIKTLCKTQSLLEYIPTEDAEKLAYRLYNIFSLLRSEWIMIPRLSKNENDKHHSCIMFLIKRLSLDSNLCIHDDKEADKVLDEADINITAKHTTKIDTSNASQNWIYRLFYAWFILNMFDRGCVLNEPLSNQILNLSTGLLVSEKGQPLQRLALGMFGKFIRLMLEMKYLVSEDVIIRMRQKLGELLTDSSFVTAFCNAVAHDHRETGEHGPQWSTVVEEIIRDSGSAIAGKLFFPFQRNSRASKGFKLQHAQLLEDIVSFLTADVTISASSLLLDASRNLAKSPPSEDQKNQQYTSFEIFSGVCRALVRNIPSELWGEALCISYLSEVLQIFPLSMSTCTYDAVRFVIRSRPTSDFLFLIEWVIAQIEENLWQRETNVVDSLGNECESFTSDGFSFQSKLLTLTNSILTEVDHISPYSYYSQGFLQEANFHNKSTDAFIYETVRMILSRLLPRLLASLSHPYEQCRGSIVGCIFKICHLERKLLHLPGISCRPTDVVLSFMENANMGTEENFSFREQCHARITIGKYILGCVRWGDCKYQSRSLIRLLPTAFENLKVAEIESSDSSRLLLDAQVVKIFRHVLAELSSMVFVSIDNPADIGQVLQALMKLSGSSVWQVRQVTAHFLRCFQCCHKFLLDGCQGEDVTNVVAAFLCDGRSEVSSAALAALIGVLAATPSREVHKLVTKYEKVASCSLPRYKSSKKRGNEERSKSQQTSVYFLCAAVLSRPYTTPKFVPIALAAISKHSFERNAPLGVRETVKKCCRDYKRTHMDQWHLHRKLFTQEQLESLDDVVSTPHYYA